MQSPSAPSRCDLLLAWVSGLPDGRLGKFACWRGNERYFSGVACSIIVRHEWIAFWICV